MNYYLISVIEEEAETGRFTAILRTRLPKTLLANPSLLTNLIQSEEGITNENFITIFTSYTAKVILCFILWEYNTLIE
jgi:hypothetical protein